MRTAFIAAQLLCCTLLRAQQAEVTRYDVENGLPQSMVNHVLQDRDGFIWLGTGDGLARFDGQRFTVFKHDPQDSASLSHNSIWGLAENGEGHLWVGTMAGLDRMDARTGRFARVNTGSGTMADGCWQPILQRQGTALFYSPLTVRLLEVNGDAGTTRQLRHAPSYAMHADLHKGVIVQALWPDTLLTIMPGGEERIFRLPIEQSERINELLPWNGRWLVLTDRSAWTWSEEEGRRSLPAATQAWMDGGSKRKRGAIAPDGRIWVGHSGVGVAVLDEELRIQQFHPLLPESERPLDITVIAFDHQGNTWVGTDGKGVFRIAPQSIKFGRAMPGQGLPWEPQSWFVRGFGQWDAQQVLVNFYQGGLAIFDERSHTLRPLELPASARAALTRPDLHGPLADGRGTLWFWDNQTVHAIEPGTGRLLTTGLKLAANALAIGTDGDARILSRKGLRALRHGSGGLHEEDLLSARLHHWMDSLGIIPSRMAIDASDRMLVCQSLLPIAAWKADQRIPVGPFPATTRFTSVTQTASGDLWMTTNEGLYLLTGTDLSISRHWSMHDGLPDQFLYGMLPDGMGAWWISTNNGLSLFDPATDRFTNSTTADGLQSPEFNSSAFFRSASGRLYLGGVNGFNHFLSGAAPADPDSARVVLIGLAGQDEAIDIAGLGSNPTVALPYGRNQLRIELAILEMTAPERNRYRWRIDGYSGWSEHPADRPITLTNMPAGVFDLEVIGINGDGLASSSRSLLTISVPLPFTASPWFFLLLGAIVISALGGLAFLLYRRRIRQREEHAEQELKELRIRARIAHDLHDDVGSGLARITALARTAERKGTKGQDATSDVERVRALSQELMQDLRDVVWMNDPRDGELAGLLLRLRDFTQDLFEPGGTECVFQFPQPLPEHRLGSQARRNLFLIAKEAAHNALKYSGATRFTLRFKLATNEFSMELEDNGKGIPAESALQEGHGLGNMRQRAAELGAACIIGRADDGGVRVRIAGPLSALDL